MVLQSAQGTYQSAQDVVAKQNKELYPNMLTRLNKITESIHPTEAKEFLNEARIRFWLKSILPLVFDDELTIQRGAITALEAIYPLLTVANYESHTDWLAVKETIAGPYLKNVNNLRDRQDSCWYRVWSLLLKLIQRDILRSASLINRYLNIVELGFRNPNLTVRAEAFLCWKELVVLFAKSKELLAPKRIRLVCIPLKSSQSKTEQIAVNKFRVWWYLISELHDHVAEYTDIIVEPFLSFCFGPLAATPLINAQPMQLPAPGKTYEALMPMAVFALISLLGAPDDVVQRTINRTDMSKMKQPFNSSVLFAKIAKSLINSTAEATVVIAALKDTDTQTEIVSCLWRNLVTNVNVLKCYDQFNLMLDNVDSLVEYSAANEKLTPLTLHVVHQVATAETFVHDPTTDPDVARLSACIERIAKLLMNTKIQLSEIQLDEIIETWFALSTFEHRGYNVRDLLPRLLSFLTSTVNGDHSSAIRFRLWNVLRHAFVLNIDSFRGHSQPADAADIFHAFAMLPISTNFDSFVDYKSDWSALAETIISLDPTQRSSFCQRTIEFIRTVKNKPHNEIVASLIDLEESQFRSTDALPISIFQHINTMCSATSAATTIKDLNCIAQALHVYTKRLDGAQLIRMYPQLKSTFEALESTVMSMRCDQAACNEFKNIVALHMRTQKPTQHLVRLLTDDALKKELSAMQKVDAGIDFVVIPSVWKFNPDRLTDQQRDKMKERRTDIPALYNDNSQSQESRSIKPWTPQKLVIQESDAEPMVIEVESAAIPTQHSEEPHSSEVTVIEVDAEPLPLSQSSNSSHGSTASAMQKLTTEELEEKRKKQIEQELRKIQVDIVDNEFTVKSRTRQRRNSCSSPAADVRSTRGKSKSELSDELAERRTNNNSKKGRKSEAKKTTDTNGVDAKTGDNAEVSKAQENTRTRRSSRAPDSSQTSNASETDKKSKTETINPTTVASVVSTEKSGVISKVVEIEPPSNQCKDVATKCDDTDSAVQSSLDPQVIQQKLPNESSTQMESVDLSTEAIEASQQSPSASVTGRRSIRRSTKVATPQSNHVPVSRLNKSPTTQTMDTLPMDTECALEVMEIDRMPKNHASPNRIPIDAPTPDSEDQAIAQADTEPNTQTSLTTSMLNITNDEPEDVPIPLTPPPQTDEGIIVDEANQSILCSPRCTDVEDRNAEFLNDTLNISPIHEKKPSQSPEPSTPKAMMTNKESPKSMKFLRNETPPLSGLVSTLPASTFSPSTHPHLPIKSCVTPLQMRYQAGIQSSTPQQSSSSIMSAFNGSTTTTTASSLTNSPSTPKFMQFKGRGAQLLNMISKKKELPKPDFSDTLHQPPTSESIENTDINLVPAVAPHKDLLTFSKTLPSPMASPSFSILKRKFVPEPEQNVDDFESPASKRKRVSFHDPPVSSTKEYIGHADEHPDRAIRPLVQSIGSNHNNIGSPSDQRIRNVLRRKSRADSMVEIAKFGKPKISTLNAGLGPNTSPPQLPNTSIEMEPLTWNASTVSETDQEAAAIITLDELDDIITTPTKMLQFDDKAAILQHVADECTLDDVLEKFEMNAATAKVFTRHLSTIMAKDKDVRSTVLDQLAENHPLEFLDYAVRSNYSTAVCAKLDPDVVINRTVELAKGSDAVRSSLFEAIATLTDSTPAEDAALLKLQATSLEQMAKSAKEDTASTARKRLMDTIGSVVDADTEMTDEQMRLMMRIFDRPMNDKQICECIQMFSRNRRRN